MNNVYCEVSEKKIDPAAVVEFTNDTSHGAKNYFFGAVRKSNVGKNVVAVAYDAAIPLAIQSLKEIANEAVLKWGTSLKICVFHRVGKLEVGEVSVAIGVSSIHRDESYLASRYVIEQLKVRAPIWKKEYYLDGETQWLKGHALCQHTHNFLE